MRMEPNNKKKLFSLDEATNAITELLAHGTIDTQIAHRFFQELESGKNTFILVPEFIVGESSAAIKNILAE